jgi:penicillin amidase
VGYIPFKELPNLYDPPSGLIVTANQRIVGTDYKYPQMARDIASPWRARRIYELLNAKTKITMDDVRDVQHDAFSIPLDMFAKAVVKSGAVSAETLDVLKGWDGRMTVASRGAVLANELRNCVGSKIAEANTPVPAGIIRERIVERAMRDGLDRWLPQQTTFGDLFKACDQTSRAALRDPKRLGPNPAAWAWGRVFQSRFPHPLAAAPLIGMQFATPTVGIDGSGTTPNVGAGVSMRHIASPGNWDATRLVIPMGQSGNPLSPHFKDQFDAWRTGAAMMFPFSKGAIAGSAKESMVLSPK